MARTLVLVLSLLTAFGLAAGEDTQPPVLVFYDVSDLVGKIPDFTGPSLDLRPAGAGAGTEAFFGMVNEGEPLFGGVEEIVEPIEEYLAPDIWGEPGVEIAVPNEQSLAVSAPPAVQEKVRAFLAALRRDYLRLVTVRAWLIETEPPGGARLTREEGLRLAAAAEKGEGARLVASGAVAGFDGRLASVFLGRERSFVQDYDVEVCEGGASISDPIVNVLSTGFRFDVRPSVLDGKVVLDVFSEWSAPRVPLAVRRTEAGLVTAPDVSFVDLGGVVTVPDGGFAAITSSDRGDAPPLVLLLSARTDPVAFAEGPAGGPVPVFPEGSGPLELRRYRVGDLDRPLAHHPGPGLHLDILSQFDFGVEEETEPAVPGYDGDSIADFLRDSVAPESWGEGGADAMTRNGVLAIRQTPGVHALVARALGAMRAALRREVAVSLRLVRTGDAELRRVLAGGPAVLGEEGERRLAQAIAEGEAEVVRRDRVVCTEGQRMSLADVALTSCLADYDVEIAEGATISDPIIRPLRHGTVVDVLPRVAAAGSVVVLETRVARTVLTEPMAEALTPAGALQTPETEMEEVRTTVAVPAGGSVVVGGFTAGPDGDAFVVVATPTVLR